MLAGNSIVSTRWLRLAALAAAAAALGACSDATGPGAEDQPNPDYTVQVMLNSVSAPAVCEEAFTDFDGGEFVWSISVTWPDGSVQVLDETSGYPSPPGFQTLRQGEARSISSANARRVRTIRSAPGNKISITVRASEIDFNLFGNNPFADGRLNDTRMVAEHTFGPGGWPQGPFEAMVQNASACRFQANYTITATQ
ncbi:MAG: hypothetical protein L0271_07215 [Gemmatimonadetes bacterium]|nr:hypothetical protein [Gemmatimonadota bacterium]